MYRNHVCMLLLVLGIFLQPAFSATPSKPGAKLYFIAPTDGETVVNPVVIKFGLKGMGVAPAGVDRENTGHHHLLIDVDQIPPMNQPLPKDKHHVHYGGGQTEAVIELPPGKHSLQLLFGDLYHIPHAPALISEKITIIVK